MTTTARARVHNFSISLDGFGTGEGLSRDEPFGHAGERLHEWMFNTRWWPGSSGGSGGGWPGHHPFLCSVSPEGNRQGALLMLALGALGLRRRRVR